PDHQVHDVVRPARGRDGRREPRTRADPLRHLHGDRAVLRLPLLLWNADLDDEVTSRPRQTKWASRFAREARLIFAWGTGLARRRARSLDALHAFVPLPRSLVQLADVLVAHLAVAVEHVEARPVAIADRLPRLPIRIERHREIDRVARHRARHAHGVALFLELRRLNAD